MKRSRSQQKLKSFDYIELFPELKDEVRVRCPSSSLCMLGMTCREERARTPSHLRTDVLLILAFEGDEHGLLRAQLLHKRYKKGHIKKLHRIRHVMIAASQCALVKWFIDELPPIMSCMTCSECVFIAAHAHAVNQMIRTLLREYTERPNNRAARRIAAHISQTLPTWTKPCFWTGLNVPDYLLCDLDPFALAQNTS